MKSALTCLFPRNSLIVSLGYSRYCSPGLVELLISKKSHMCEDLGFWIFDYGFTLKYNSEIRVNILILIAKGGDIMIFRDILDFNYIECIIIYIENQYFARKNISGFSYDLDHFICHKCPGYSREYTKKSNLGGCGFLKFWSLICGL